MSDPKDLRNEPWAQHIPPYLVEVIAQVSDAKDEILKAMTLINERTADLRNREQLLLAREESFVNAAADLKEFANRVYGPDSELTKIHAKLASAEMAATNREARNARLYEQLTETQSGLRTWVVEQLRLRDTRMDGFEKRLHVLEQKSA